MAKRDFIPAGATCWQGGCCTHKGITRRHRYVTGAMGGNSNLAPILTTGTHLATRLTLMGDHTGIESRVRRPRFFLSSAYRI